MTQTTNSTCIFKEGDIIRVLDAGHTYDLYKTLAEDLGLENWRRKSVPQEGRRYIVVREPLTGSRILAIQDMVWEQEYLINQDGVEHAE